MKKVIYDGFKEALAGGVPRTRPASWWTSSSAPRSSAMRRSTATTRPARPRRAARTSSTSSTARTSPSTSKFRPTFCKVLVRYNPEGDAALNRRQRERLKRLSDYLHSGGPSRVHVRAAGAREKAQLERSGGDKKEYDQELRPELMVQAITELQDAGIEADVWKIEGIDRARGLRQGRRGRATRRARPRRLHHPGPRRGRREGPPVAQDRRGRPGLHRLRRRPDQLLGPADRVEGRPDAREAAVSEIARRYREWVDIFEAAPSSGRERPRQISSEQRSGTP